jgi:hypothetical protein
MRVVTECSNCGVSIDIDDIEYYLEDEDDDNSEEHTICPACEHVDTFVFITDD